MKLSWTKGLDAEQKKDLKISFSEGLVMRHRLVELLESMVGTSQRLSRSKDAYESPNWAYLQADARGYERAMHEIMELILEK